MVVVVVVVGGGVGVEGAREEDLAVGCAPREEEAVREGLVEDVGSFWEGWGRHVGGGLG